MALRLRYEIDTAARLREHVHVVDGAGYFFFPGASAAAGTPAVLEVTFTAADQTALLRGSVWTHARGGLWLELPGAADSLARVDTALRRDLRIATTLLVLAEAPGSPALLCRLRDVGHGGARILARAKDLGGPEARVRVALPEAGPTGAQLEAFGRLAWAGEGEVGVEWVRGDLASRAAVLRLVQLAEDEWEGARSASHAPACRCANDFPPRHVLLLG